LTTALEEQETQQRQIEQPKQQQNEKIFYVLKKKSLGGHYEPVALYLNGSFRGLAVFTSLSECEQYQKEFEDRLMKRFLKPRKYKKDYSQRIQTVENSKTRKSGKTMIFEESKNKLLNHGIQFMR
jgi:hypothetical protein